MTVAAAEPLVQREPDGGPRISVVVCAFTADRLDALHACVASVRAQTRPAHELLVVIDHDDLLLARARAGLGPLGVPVVPSEAAPGLAGARNTGVRLATGDVVAFIDDDARADCGWLAEVARAHARPGVLGTGGLVAPSWSAAPPAWLPPELYWVVGCSYRGLPVTEAPVRAPIGASMSFARAVLEEAGGFAEELGRLRHVPGSCEDTEMAVRAQRVRPGGVVLHLPHARVAHTVPRSRTTWRYLRWRCWTEGRAKAELTRLAGPQDGLSAERSYVARVLPAAFARGLRDGLRGDPDGPRRSAAVLVALALTAAGYAYGLVTRRGPDRRDWR